MKPLGQITVFCQNRELRELSKHNVRASNNTQVQYFAPKDAEKSVHYIKEIASFITALLSICIIEDTPFIVQSACLFVKVNAKTQIKHYNSSA